MSYVCARFFFYNYMQSCCLLARCTFPSFRCCCCFFRYFIPFFSIFIKINVLYCLFIWFGVLCHWKAALRLVSSVEACKDFCISLFIRKLWSIFLCDSYFVYSLVFCLFFCFFFLSYFLFIFAFVTAATFLSVCFYFFLPAFHLLFSVLDFK